ncbi:MAG: hypothetical protein GX051_03900 [Clostridiales bacterium]|nr:hypothetical protein [Clostridiales bacterium]
MKCLKILLSCLVCAVLLFGCFGVLTCAEQFTRGDLDGSGKVTAAEARRILRCATKLETFSDSLSRVADIDSDGIVSAADARSALRIATGLDVVEVVYDNPQQIDSLLNAVNAERAEKSLEPYTYSAAASSAAYKAAREYEQTAPSYFRPGGANWETVLSECGVSASLCAKTIYISPDSDADVITELMNDPTASGHILNRNYKSIGIGIYTAGNSEIYRCLIFFA